MRVHMHVAAKVFVSSQRRQNQSFRSLNFLISFTSLPARDQSSVRREKELYLGKWDILLGIGRIPLKAGWLDTLCMYSYMYIHIGLNIEYVLLAMKMWKMYVDVR